jgi:hypothetical protein
MSEENERHEGKESEPMMRRSFISVVLILIFIFIALAAFFRWHVSPHAQTNTSNAFSNTHILGGFSIDTPERATKAVRDGVQVVFKYGQPPSLSDKLGQKLQALHMKVIDGYIWSLLYYYECHRLETVKPAPSDQGQYCQKDYRPDLQDESALLSAVAAHLKQVKENRLIIGYWVLDDWVSRDAGSARQLLVKVHNLIRQYTPDRLSICGFGGDIWLNQRYGWNDWIADNFSPQGCDMVGLYIYASSTSYTTRLPVHATFNWSMTGLLPAMFASLEQRGWNIKKEPFIGIGQAFGGPIANLNRYWVTPYARDIEVQSRSFCEHGATGLAFYAWDNSGFGPTTQTPMNSPEIDRGIQSGIAACETYWSKKK